MATTTKTLGPLHFEDLEPKRFEDLVRQLAYEFKPWRKLEATGRSGSDDGFDARGYEIVGGDTTQRSSDGETEVVDETAVREGAEDRLWLIQCKRERAIGPKALTDYLDGVVLSPDEQLYGIVFTAAADFSKKARDDFAKKCKAMGLQEWHLWGKAELEDKLFQPAADHLLFAYFGISLTIRRRTQRTELRARLAMKRKANRLLKDYQHQFLLLRPPEAPSYPHSRDVRDPETGEPPWFVREYRQMSHEGLVFCVRRYFAYLHDDGEQWDAAMAFNHVRSSPHQDPWRREEEDYELRSRIQEVWDAFPKANKAWLEVLATIPFENILDIDELGDEHFEEPHIYAPFFDRLAGPFATFYARVETTDRYDPRVLYPSRTDGRIEVFEADFRKDKPGP
ncbi:Restriction endonuclease [Mitsuaria sp. PDC51]|uniref:restriction endonuclease n=2 Tax=Pseudomonadota TaxID=1224 RepID=UPI0008F0AE2E|nr:restriction endonuclease [Mitsuaria sp. PDC51]SFR74957.1 Restriction endonuclease [Mitsuaria sp. PDC51]